MISSIAASGVRKNYTCTDILSLNIELVRVVAQEKFIVLSCLCSITNTRVIAARPGVSSDPSKSLNEVILLSCTHLLLEAPLLEWLCLLAALVNFRNCRRQEACWSSHKEQECSPRSTVTVIISQPQGPALPQKYSR